VTDRRRAWVDGAAIGIGTVVALIIWAIVSASVQPAAKTVTLYTTDAAGRPRAVEVVLLAGVSHEPLDRRTIDTADWTCPMSAPCSITLLAGAEVTVILAPTLVVRVRN
jgi:hypothetical protein